ncbi:hypothetical protein [Thalassotalea ganghwensis]
MSEKSLQERCYISIATVKRAELNQPLSNSTIKKFATFFNVSIDSLIRQKPGFISDLTQELQLKKTTINWQLVTTLSNRPEHEKLSTLCNDLYRILQQYKDDKQINEIFSHRF